MFKGLLKCDLHNQSLPLPLISGIARCFTFGGSKKRTLHDPAILPRSDLSKEKYMNKEEQTTINHFHEKLLKLKDMMKTKVHLYYIFSDLIKFSPEKTNCAFFCLFMFQISLLHF